MSRSRKAVVLVFGLTVLCSCSLPEPPHVAPPPLPLNHRIRAAEPNQYMRFSDSRRTWKNPRLVITAQGIRAIVAGASPSPLVPPQSVPTVLEDTSPADWPLGLVVMLSIGIVDGDFKSVDSEAFQRNRADLLRSLSESGIQVVWDAPPA